MRGPIEISRDLESTAVRAAKSIPPPPYTNLMGPTKGQRRVVIGDVAASAGVSTTTVSHSLNGRGTVSPATREHVIATAARLGYQPNRVARSLRTTRTETLALILSDVGMDIREMMGLEIMMRMVLAAVRAACARNQRLLIMPPITRASEALHLGVDGVILSDLRADDPQLELFAEAGIPVVTTERVLGHPEHDWYVGANNPENTRTLLDHLAASGGRRIALLAPNWRIAWIDEQLEAYYLWCDMCGQTALVDIAPDAPLTNVGYERAGRLLDRRDPPDAILCLAEGFATGVLRAAAERGLSVPGDVLLASAMDGVAHQIGTPSVTALDQDSTMMGEAAISLLLERIRGNDQAERPLIVPATMHVRESTTQRS